MTPAFDERFYKPKPGRKKKGKELFYELRQVEKDKERCPHCGFPIAGPDGVFFAYGMEAGPFCRPECARDYYGLKAKMKRLVPDSD